MVLMLSGLVGGGWRWMERTGRSGRLVAADATPSHVEEATTPRCMTHCIPHPLPDQHIFGFDSRTPFGPFPLCPLRAPPCQAMGSARTPWMVQLAAAGARTLGTPSGTSAAGTRSRPSVLHVF